MIFRRLQPLGRSLPFLFFVALASWGCRPGSESTEAVSTSPAQYGDPTGTAAVSIARSAKLSAGAERWETNTFFVLRTELSPATLVHSATPHLTVFAGMTNAGLAAPAFVAWPTKDGPRTFKRGEPLDVSVMTEGWVLVWWAGATGWTHWDSPWVLFLQHKPKVMSLDDDGLHLDFPKQAGDMVMLPLYGYDKLAQEQFDFRSTNQLAGPKIKVKTWEWPKVITRDPLTRIRYWDAAMRNFPIHCAETFSVDRAKESVTVRSRIEWRSIEDDWKTRRIKLAPLSPSLALVAKDKRIPVHFSARWFDLEMSTPYGPYLGIEGVDEYETTIPLLGYLDETESAVGHDVGTNALAVIALETLVQVAARPDASLRSIQGSYWFARALPFLEEGPRSQVTAELQRFLGDLLTSAPDLHSPALLTALWAYAHESGDWPLVRRHWPAIQRMFSIPRTMTWAGFGARTAAGDGNTAAQCIAFARLAYKVGDMDAYHYACLVFVRELATATVRQSGIDYFRQHQPWNSLAVIGPDAAPTDCLPDARGWQFSGLNRPGTDTTPGLEGPRERIDNPDLARFYRNHLSVPVREQILRMSTESSPRDGANDAAGRPSVVQLRSLLFNELPDDPDSARRLRSETRPSSGRIADCLAILRAARPGAVQRLIPPGAPGAFVTGIEREDDAANTGLLVAIGSDGRKAGETEWPELLWPGWSTPTRAPWTFGHIRPIRDGVPVSGRRLPLNWNSQIEVIPVEPRR